MFKSTYARHKYQLIRHHARMVTKYHELDRKCHVCGYKTHTQICHKKQINSFNKNTKLKEVNDINNLVILCPNHHWELDHGVLAL